MEFAFSDGKQTSNGVRADREVEADRITWGFVDAHGHPAGLGQRLAELDLTGIETYDGVLERVKEEVERVESGTWIVGRGWDQNDWVDVPASGWPEKSDLDRLAPNNPVRLRRVDGHAAWINQSALDATGLTELKAASGGRVVYEGQRFVGILVDEAMSLVPAPAVTTAELRRRVALAMDELAQSGLVGVHAMGVSDAELDVYQALDAEMDLPIRLWVYLTPDAEAVERLLADGPWQGDKVRVVGIKAFADGALGSRGALLSEDYADEPGHRGASITSEAELLSLATRCLEVRAQLAVHAIGDAAVANVLDAFEDARRLVPSAVDVPLRVEHAQVVQPADRGRFAALNVVASMQPVHATSDMPWAEARLGPERIKWAYTWRALRDAGALLAFGSDFPVEEVDLDRWMLAATRRVGASGDPEGGWTPGETLTPIQASDAFTIGAWAALGGGVEPHVDQWGLTTWSVGEDGSWRVTGSVLDGEFRSASEGPTSRRPVSSN